MQDEKQVSVSQEETLLNEISDTKKPKTEWEKIVENMLHRAYLNGLSIGMKTMCRSILSKMDEFEKKKLNPQKQIIQLRRWCEHCLETCTSPETKEAKEIEMEESTK